MHRMTAVAITLALAAGVALAGGGGKIEWQKGKNLDDVVKEAKKSGKTVMVYFTADW